MPGHEYSFLSIRDLRRDERSPVDVAFDNICSKSGDWFGPDDVRGARYEMADIRFPGILVADMPNPCSLPYRMIDGRRLDPIVPIEEPRDRMEAQLELLTGFMADVGGSV